MMTFRPYNNGGKWKLDAAGNIELKDGNPVFIASDGKEMTLGTDTVSRLNNEARTNRERAEAAETKLQTFKDLDPTKARDALEMLSRIDQKKLIDAGEVDKVRNEVGAQYQTQLTDKEKRIAELQDSINNMTLENAFANSKFIKDNVAVPVEMVRATFANRFKVEDGKIVVYDSNNQKMYHSSKMSELADFEEGIKQTLESYTYKDAILKGSNHSGTGNNGGNGGDGQRTIRRNVFDSSSPAQQQQYATAASKGELKIVD